MSNFFEGKYYKHQKDGETICFIVGEASSGAFVQVVTNEKVWQYDSWDGFTVNAKGISVDKPEIKGEVCYDPLTPLHKHIMGPYRFMPMQCSHSVYSMAHGLTGGFEVEGKCLDFTGGLGYIEGDSGRSFPKEYLWLHCNDFSVPCSIMASVADIPFCGRHFMGCICAILHGDEEYRLATYHGVKIIEAGRERLELQQDEQRLLVEIDVSTSQPLKAPSRGQMIDTIHESNCARARFRYWEGEALLFDLQSDNLSFECNLTDKSTER